MTAAPVNNEEAAQAIIAHLLDECRKGTSDRETEALRLASEFEIDEEYVRENFKNARKLRDTDAAKKPSALPYPVLVTTPSEGVVWRRPQIPLTEETASTVVPAEQVPTSREPEPAPEPPNAVERERESAKSASLPAIVAPTRLRFPRPGEKRMPMAVSSIKFHPSDFVIEASTKLTVAERDKAIEELADLKITHPFEFAEKRKALAKQLYTTVDAIDQAVKITRDKRNDDVEQSQATKIVAIGIGEDVQLWHAPNGDGYASLRFDGHRENHRITSRGFEHWILYEYGRRNPRKVGDQWVPQAPGSGSIRDAIAQLEGIARYKGDEFQPAIRVGGDREMIWIDLGGKDWRAVRVTSQGWEVVSNPNVAFVRNGTMQSLPEPVRDGSVEPLRKVVNVQAGDFVLVVGWLLQTLNPIGPYPVLDVHGPSEAGKSTTSRMILRVADPNSVGLRRPSRKVEDLLIAARNGWTVGLDNVSGMTNEWADHLCMLATGIASGTRALYTNDEEHVYSVQRPILFNGIPSHLTERSDLASRAIKLQLSPISARQTEAALGAEFERIWPSVFGALLDGLVGALRDCDAINVEVPARLMDFERFAEAGCRAIGFREWEFVEAYSGNRRSAMAISLEASAVGQAVLKFMKKVGREKGFAGQMSELKSILDMFNYDVSRRDWPKDPTRLSSALDRIAKPLATAGIDCQLRVDRRSEGGSQVDVVLQWHTEAPRT